MTIGTGILVDGPPPRAPLYTLVSASNVVPTTDTDEHHFLGVQVRPYPCGVAHAWDWVNRRGDDGAGVKITMQGFAAPGFRGFTVYMREQCNARGIDGARFADRVNLTFPAVEAYAVEREFWTGLAMPDSPHLAGNVPDPLAADTTLYPAGDTPLTKREGWALLEACIALSGRQGVIHCTPSLIASIQMGGSPITRSGGANPTLQTVNGNVVVPGFGYQSAAAVLPGFTPVPPAGHAAPTGSQEWAIATGPVDIRRSVNIETVPEATDDAVWQALDRTNNLLAYEATRNYVLAFDACFKAAVLIDRAT